MREAFSKGDLTKIRAHSNKTLAVVFVSDSFEGKSNTIKDTDVVSSFVLPPGRENKCNRNANKKVKDPCGP